jgi:site-specific DNA-methyltransferase (cytosine-N4-specific)
MIDPPNATTKDAAAVAQGLRTREGNTFHLDMERTGRNIRTVWTIPTQPFPEAHFATFPEDLVKPCILAGSREGDTVLDPFCGSGTTGVVAARFGRKFIGIELNPEYVRMANRRIKQEQPLIAGTEPL